MPNGKCSWKWLCSVGRGAQPGQTAQAHSDTPASSFCSFISAQKGDRMQLHGNLLDKETLPRAASTEFCLAKQLLQVRLCWSRTGIWFSYSPECRDKSTQSRWGAEYSGTCHRSQRILSRPFCAFLCLVLPWHNGKLQAGAAHSPGQHIQPLGSVGGELSIDQGLQLSPEHQINLCMRA